jgi:hypothetical protein
MNYAYVDVVKRVFTRLFVLIVFVKFSGFEASAQNNIEKNPRPEYKENSSNSLEVAQSDVSLAQIIGRITKLQEMFSQSGIQAPPKKMAKQMSSRCPNIPLNKNGWPDEKQLKATISLNMDQGQMYLDLLMSLYKEIKSSSQK